MWACSGTGGSRPPSIDSQAAALYGLTDVVQFLAEKGASLDTKDIYGQSAMSIALADPDGLVYRHLKPHYDLFIGP